MNAVSDVGVEDGAASAVEGETTVVAQPLTCDTDTNNIPYAEQCDVLKEGQVHDDGEVLLVQGLRDFQGVVSAETVVLDDGQVQAGTELPAGLSPGPYQQYQPVVVQGFLTSTGEVVHVVQQDAPVSQSHGHGHRTLAPQPQQYQHPHPHSHQPQPMMHPDLYRLIKMFPDFSTKTLHRIFVMCRYDLKRALDQALFARQFRQLDSAPAYSPIAPSATPHFHPSPYRSHAPGPAPPYMQPDLGLTTQADMYQPRGHGRAQGGHQPQQPVLLYQQADPRLKKTAAPAAAAACGGIGTLSDADVVEIKLSDQGLPGGMCLAGLEGPDVDASLGGDGVHCSKEVLVSTPGSDTKEILTSMVEATVKDTTEVCEVATSQAAVVC